MTLLAPFGALYGAAAALRVAAYRSGLVSQARLSGPVISVGNLSVGGSGKTPVVQRIAEILLEGGLPVAILSRGYRGSFTNIMGLPMEATKQILTQRGLVD